MLNIAKSLMTALALLGLLLVPPSLGTATTGEGQIYCILAMPFLHTSCDPEGRTADEMHFTTGAEVVRLTLVITWVPVSHDAEELTAVLWNNGELAQASGVSPITLTLEGAAASAGQARGEIDLAPVCTSDPPLGSGFPLNRVPSSCKTPPLKLVENQQFMYAWTVE